MKAQIVKTFAFALIIAAIFLPWCFNWEIQGAVQEEESSITNEDREKILQHLYAPKISAIDSILDFYKKHYSFNGNVLVASKGQILYNQAIGYADPRKRVELRENEIYQLASVSKQFTAMAVMILKERGMLSYEDTVTKYLDLPYEGITIHQLLTHSSGLPNYFWLVEHHWKKQGIPYNDDVIALMNKHKLPLYFRPGSRYTYSNTGYIVLASVVEKVSGESFASFLQKEIFEPLAMTNSFVYSAAKGRQHEEKLSGYYRWGRSYRLIPHTVNDGAVGDKGIYSTGEDLYKWDQALYSSKLVSLQTLEEAYSQLILHGRYRINYGFGVRLKNIEEDKTVYHHGKWNGFRTSIMRFVDREQLIVILNNTNRSLNNRIIRSLDAVLKSDPELEMAVTIFNNLWTDDNYLIENKEEKLFSDYDRNKLQKYLKEIEQFLTKEEEYKSVEKLKFFTDDLKEDEITKITPVYSFSALSSK